MTLWPFGKDANAAQQNSQDVLATLLVMAWTVEARDPYTGGHLWRVSRMAEVLARRAGLSGIDVSRVAIGGFLHDLGNIGTPDTILRKTGPLDDDEYDIIHTHPSVGARLLASHPLAALALDAVRSHHERPDGTGYPDRLKAEDIPLDARIISVCDAFDAMTSHRPYRKAMTIAEAMAAIRQGIGTQFDRRFGEHFLALSGSGVLEHIVGHSDDGVPLLSCTMCGPILVARRGQGAGDTLHCRNCGGEYALATGPHGTLEARQTGRVGSPRELEPSADTALIRRFIDGGARTAIGHRLRIAA